ncbi:hypothetical protein H4696_003317 [Amycolatopsis lexingtonensis]|uniref:Putative host cell surface-exposed lipoprotein Ltp-like HTH region domain-containing protein n=1 Tax=Amycolatopsis lexingtonensis TaxID=218822 RepID=A0ABR9HZ49_9PSEU|nr:Ltp family lipoprotein [Amycolatopsis lexingtonensis]MBE1496217.1 hypothetical protein [Amycolatopsis lexingtonensis]
MKKILIGVSAGFALLVIATACNSPAHRATAPSQLPAAATTQPATTQPVTYPPSTPSPPSPSPTNETSTVEAAAQFSPQVEMARDKAQSYLGFSAFSRNGLIRQLSSDAGEGFPKAVATEAVDSLSVDWNVQAVKSAESYLSFTSFSCSGLKQQLSSSAGEGYTKAQAAYGAGQTDACK